MTGYRLIAEKSIPKSELFEIKEHTVETPSGKNIIHHNVYRDPSVLVFPLTDNDDLYLAKQYRYLYKMITLEAVAGFIGKGETSLSAAKRELKEETGITAMQLEEIARIYISGSVVRAYEYLFLAKELQEDTANPDEDENIEVVKIPLKFAVEKVANGEIIHGGTMVGILLLEKLKREKKL